MNKVCELNKDEFAALANTEAMVLFMASKYVVTEEQVEHIRKHAQLPFHVRGNDYPKQDLIVYFSSREESIQFMLYFEEQKRNPKPAPRIVSINKDIDTKE